MGRSFEWEYHPVFTYHGVYFAQTPVHVRRCDFCKAKTTMDNSDTCRNCLEVFQGIADAWDARGEDVAQLLRKWPPHHSPKIQHGRPWQDHVPAHSKHLIREQP